MIKMVPAAGPDVTCLFPSPRLIRPFSLLCPLRTQTPKVYLELSFTPCSDLLDCRFSMSIELLELLR